MTDPIADMLTRIRNASMALLPTVGIPHSKMKESLGKLLVKEGYVAGLSVEGDKIKTLTLKLKYTGRQGVIEGIRRISRPGLRNYVGSTEIPRVRGGLGVAVISTPEGVMSGHEARRKNLGGEVVCYVW
jgi:small subunit ribosomal protein S8